MTTSFAEPLLDLPHGNEAPSPQHRPDTPLTVIDLFAGAGGLSEGFRQAGFRIVAGSDVDPDACRTYALNFPEAAVICGDVRSQDVHSKILAAGYGVDVVVGGPPCQAFSQVRNHSRLIDDPRNSLYREFVALVGQLSPRAFLMENVPGLAQMGVLEQVVEDLELGGNYRVNPQVVDAADFGVPQTRKRIVFLGIRKDLAVPPLLMAGSGATETLALVRHNKGSYSIGRKGGDSDTCLRQLADSRSLAVVSVEQAISDLRHLEAGRRTDTILMSELGAPESAYQRLMRRGVGTELTNVSVPRINKDTVTRLSSLPQGGNHRDLDESLLARYISGQRWGPSTDTGRLVRAHFYAYRKLHPQIWAWTLNTKADSAYHYLDPRALSVREFARLQSFPDRFVFATDPRRGNIPGRIGGGPAHSRYRQVGNAVPPLLALAMAREVAKVVRTARLRNRTA